MLVTFFAGGGTLLFLSPNFKLIVSQSPCVSELSEFNMDSLLPRASPPLGLSPGHKKSLILLTVSFRNQVLEAGIGDRDC